MGSAAVDTDTRRLPTQFWSGPDSLVRSSSVSRDVLIWLSRSLRRAIPNSTSARRCRAIRQLELLEIWFIDPFDERLRIYTKTQAGHTSRVVDSGLLESAVVSRFSIDVAWLWQEDLPSTLGCLRWILG